MDFIIRTPDTSPTGPHLAEVVQIYLGCSHEVEGEPVFVGAAAGWCYWVVSLPTEKRRIQAFLLAGSSERAGDSGLHACATREVDKLLRWLLEFGYEILD